MQLYTITLLLPNILLLLTNIEADKYGCSEAVGCVHTKKPLCGIRISINEVRWFLDKCDLLEYNCEHKTRFKKAKRRKCSHIPITQVQETSTHLNYNKSKFSDESSNKIH